MNVLLFLIAFAVALPILLYAFAPAVLFRRVQAALRRKAKLVRKTVHVDGIAWPYLEGGPAHGEPVVMVHGFGADKDHWTYYAPFMTGEYRLIAPDLPGFGENDLSANRSYAIKAQADRLSRRYGHSVMPSGRQQHGRIYCPTSCARPSQPS